MTKARSSDRARGSAWDLGKQRTESFVGESFCLLPGAGEGLEGFTVGYVDQDPADANADLPLVRAGGRWEDSHGDVLGTCSEDLGSYVETVVMGALAPNSGHAGEVL